MSHLNRVFEPLNIAVLTVSDTRDASNDTSGDYLAISAAEAGHKVNHRHIVIDDVYLIRAQVSAYIADPDVQAILITGGTGFTRRDSTPEALLPLFDKEVEGFGELFRHMSYQEIGTSTVQSRAIAGLANGTVVFCLPGSTGACKTAWQGIIRQQLDGSHGPCNFVPHLKASVTPQCETRSL
ncbi:molybdenum cofactor biosynthesis protein B [Aestuariibacter halophilus]|uniref:Molybdenum cofactor biosynthesis protein B n=1 Tax=Fluctibacter halophilus TaxID=226011 RepID=A0ABS8G3F3_9ALTE|nr:molybdenum cofactor biosynthesis protein B [Aestuariibacter halophilus]MCC2615058.1 molybdenum cofactor biosynthesis protein B [Aestuariibacter halophilus]